MSTHTRVGVRKRFAFAVDYSGNRRGDKVTAKRSPRVADISMIIAA